MFAKSLENKDGIFIHSVPENSNVYDIMWKRMYSNQVSGIETWGSNRKQHVFELFESVVDFSGTSVLDLCSGLGRISAAILELNAKKVVSADGSFSGLRNTRERFLSLGFEEEKHVQTQLDASQVGDCFENDFFDCVLHYYALQHMKDYKQVLLGIKKVLKKKGIVAFNYFTTGTTPALTNILRNVFLPHNPLLIYEFLDELGVIKGSSKKFEASSLNNLSLFLEKYPFIRELMEVVEFYGAEDVSKRLHLEDFTTPYLHNFDDKEIYEFTKNNFEILKFSSGKIIARKE